MAESLLAVERVSHRFGGLLAVNAASLSAPEGRITGLIGPNGAGKTTLFAIISGFLKPSEGAIRYGGKDITGEPPHRLARLGIARTFQIVQAFAGLSVRDNILVGAYLRHPSRAEALTAAERVGHDVGLGEMLGRPADTLTVAGRKRLELARALATGPKLLLLDEVMAGLRPTEVDQLVAVFRRINGETGLTILLIEHVMRAVMALAREIHVLHHGELIASGAPEEIVRHPAVLACYLGAGPP